MKKRNFTAIFLIVLVTLVVISSLDYKDNRFNLTGFALPPIEDNCPCYGGVNIDTCDSSNPPFYCELDKTTGKCSLTQNCVKCGCPEGRECNEDFGTCNTGGVQDDGVGDNDDNEDPNTCETHEGCGSGKICVGGTCVTSTGDDKICDTKNSNMGCVGDANCVGEQANCEAWERCKNIEEGLRGCKPLQCTGGIAIDSCSNNGLKCQFDNSINNVKLIPYCQGCGCANEYICEADGTCVSETPEEVECTGEECETQLSPEVIENYCEYYGGSCLQDCGTNYYELIGKEYSDLVSDCKRENKESKCCYPYSNDEINDCEYYGGTCLASCSEGYVSADVEYLDDECDYYTNRNYVCCVEYIEEVSQSDSSISSDMESESESDSLMDILFGTKEIGTEDKEKIQFSEVLSLHREKLFWGLGSLLVIIFIILGLVFCKPKKKKKRKS